MFPLERLCARRNRVRVRGPSFRSLVGGMNADGGAAALERFCILAKNYKGRGLAETIQQVSYAGSPGFSARAC